MPDTVTIRIPSTVQKELRRTCKEAGISLSTVVRESIQRYLAVRRFRKLRNKILPFAESQGILTDEDVLKAL